MSIDFAQFNVADLDVLDGTDAVALPDMGASFVVASNTDDADDALGQDQADWVVVSTSSSSS